MEIKSVEFIRGIHNIKPQHSGCVATIGNFDGLHLGHQQVLKNLIQQAKRLKLPSLVILFEPHALEYFQGDKAPARILRLREKLMLLREFGVDRVLCLYFNNQLANLSATDFVTTLLVKKLGVRFLLVGDDFHFGKQRQGDFTLLQQMANTHHFELANTETVFFDNIRVGSSRIREALAQGDFPLATQLMQRPYRMTGHVVHGDKRGGTLLGFPTANILLRRKVSPLSGVFAVKVHGLSPQALPAVANLGRRPTLDGSKKLLEVHLLDFNQDIYGRFLEVEFIEKLRDEQKFASLELLKQQIQNDVAITKKLLKLR